MIRRHFRRLSSTPRKGTTTLLRTVGEVQHRFDGHAILFSLAALVFLTCIEALDSFGLDSASDRAVAQATATLYGPFYGHGDDRAAQKKIVVALIDEDSLDDLKADGFPLPYTKQLQILQSIARHHPKAIFLDMSYMTPRKADVENYTAMMFTQQVSQPPAGVTALAEGIAAIEKQGVPVFIGPVAEDEFLLSPLKQLRQVSVDLPIEGQYGIIDEYDGVSLGDDGKPDKPLPAALALYELLCADGQEPAPGECTHTLTHLNDRVFYLQWGLGSSEKQLLRTPAELRDRCASHGSPVIQLAYLLWLGATRNLQDGYNEANVADRCFYHDSLPVWSIMMDNDVAGPMSEILKDKVVFVGGDTKASGDRWPVPFYMDMPGVAIHAMALDNLLESSGKVPLKPGEFWHIEAQDWLQIATIAAILLIFYLMSRSGRFDLTRIGPDGQVRIRRVTVGLVVSLTLAACGFILFVAIRASWPIPFVILNILAPSGITAAGLLLIGRLSSPRPETSPPSGEEQ